MNWIFLGVLLTLGGCAASTSISCQNEHGQAVDWYILYKQPSIDDQNGLRYLYMDESTSGWVQGQYTIDDKQSAVGQTLKPLFDHYATETDTFGYILYNDQPPPPYRTGSSSYGHSKGKNPYRTGSSSYGHSKGKNPYRTGSSSYGHSKGKKLTCREQAPSAQLVEQDASVVLMSQSTGIWLSHSTPDFPGFDIDSFWPKSGYHNGQTFICGTYKYTAFRDIAIQLQYIHVNAFNSHIPTSFFPELQCVARKGCFPKEAPWYRQLDMTTLSGHKFVSYAKYGRAHDDLYSDVLDKYLGSEFYAKGWGRLRRPLPSNCSVPNYVYNVESVQLPTTEPFSVTVDHSKWCVTVDKSPRPWTCIADMNREVSQESRGGGAVCTDNAAVWKAFSSVVFTYEPCPGAN
ncbi:deoxyribonuclease-2-alpha-like [Clupea harengus]|uniref:Deoxyribonuclease-2-alpha n=1 Tax=Clupea harengus TaxID=7950 RepID=A0A8M1KE66_CLUHA|nr:deoxyribonuclease-2-alpha-like [Clupea harengus]